MSDSLRHECGIALVRLTKDLKWYQEKYGTPLHGFNQLFLLMEKQHNRGTGARYTRTHRPVRLVYVEPQPDRAAAMRREIAIKRLGHDQKARLARSQEKE